MSSRAQPLPRGRSRPRLTARAGILFGLVMLVGVLSIVPIRQFFDQRRQVAELERRSSELREANAGLEQEVARLSDPKELERLARECLGMVRPGETAYVTVPKHGEAPPAEC